MIQAPHNISCVAATGFPLCQGSVILSPYSTKAVWSSLSLLFSPKTTWSSPFFAKATWFSLPGMAAVPGFKSQRQSSSAAPFPTPPTVSYTASIPYSSSFTGLP